MPSQNSQKNNPENPAIPQNLCPETAVVRMLHEPRNTSHSYAPPAISVSKGCRGVTCWAQNICQIIFYYIKSINFFKIKGKLDAVYPNLSYITALPIFVFASASTVMFGVSTIPALIEPEAHQNPKVSAIIKRIKRILATDTEYRPCKQGKYQVYVYLNEFFMQQDYGLSKKEFAALEKEITKTSYNNVEIIVLTSEKALREARPQRSAHFSKPNLLHYHPLTSSKLELLKRFRVIDIESTQSTWLVQLFFLVMPTLNSFLAAFLAANHTFEHCFGDSKNWNYIVFCLAQLLFLGLAGTKSYVNFMRKFMQGLASWEDFVYYMQHCQGKFRIKFSEFARFAVTVIFPLICSLITYLASTFFFYREGCLEQLYKTICLVFQLDCSFDLDATSTQPDIPEWQIRFGIFMMANAVITALFTLVSTSLTQFKSDRSGTTIAEITHKKAWRFVLTASCIDAISQDLMFSIGIATAISHFFGYAITDYQTLLPAGIIGSSSAFCYWLFQKVFGKLKFDETCDNFINLWERIKDFFCSLSSYCQWTPAPEKAVDDLKPLLENGMFHQNGYTSTTTDERNNGYHSTDQTPNINTKPRKQPRNTCLVM